MITRLCQWTTQDSPTLLLRKVCLWVSVPKIIGKIFYKTILRTLVRVLHYLCSKIYNLWPPQILIQSCLKKVFFYGKITLPHSQIPVSWFNFIMHLLITPDKFSWTVHMLKSPLWELLTPNNMSEETITSHIPDKCLVSQAPVCKEADGPTQDMVREGTKDCNEEVNTEQALLLPFGVENPRKRRGGKTSLVEIEVRRSDRISKENAGFKRNS